MPRPKLLLADDSITIQKVVNLTFADQGMDVVCFSDGDAAVEHLDQVKPDIVLADVHMPGINGYQLCELMRSDDANRSVPVLLLVGSFEPFDREEAERVGANGHLTKPFTSIAELISMVEELLTQSKTAEVELESSYDGPKPDTSDIDNLYEQSFAETAEMPKAEGQESFEGDAYDDEMIQTSYAEPASGAAAEDSFYTSHEEISGGEEKYSDYETENLIAESMPTSDPSPADADSADYVPEPDEAATDDTQVDPESEDAQTIQNVGEDQQSEETETTSGIDTAVESEPEHEYELADLDAEDEEPPIIYDPFESIAAELPPVAEPVEPVAAAAPEFREDDLDLLELPMSRPYSHAGSAPANGAPAVAAGIDVSPELIELIVDKVIARLEERQKA